MAATVDVACVVHLHSVHSDGTGTVAQIAAAARRAGVDVVLLTDHDTLEARRRGEEGWHGPVLVCVGSEVSPLGLVRSGAWSSWFIVFRHCTMIPSTRAAGRIAATEASRTRTCSSNSLRQEMRSATPPASVLCAISGEKIFAATG